jgi:hypothetical protein
MLADSAFLQLFMGVPRSYMKFQGDSSQFKIRGLFYICHLIYQYQRPERNRDTCIPMLITALFNSSQAMETTQMPYNQ